VLGRYWELPQGSWEQVPGADRLEVGRGELREKAGLDAARMTYVGHLFEAYGYSNIFVHREPAEASSVQPSGSSHEAASHRFIEETSECR